MPTSQSRRSCSAYVRSLDLWGRSGKLDVIAPYSWLDGSARLDGVPRAAHGRRVQRSERASVGQSVGRSRLVAPRVRGVSSRTWSWGQPESDRTAGAVRPLSGSSISAPPLVDQTRDRVSETLGTTGRSIWRAPSCCSPTITTTSMATRSSRTRSTRCRRTSSDMLVAASGRRRCNLVRRRTHDTRRPGERRRKENTRIGITLALPINARQSIKLYAATGVYVRTGSRLRHGRRCLAVPLGCGSLMRSARGEAFACGVHRDVSLALPAHALFERGRDRPESAARHAA